jgi:group I intron endonuclease
MTIKNASGVYRIVNTENGKRYYGSSNNLRKRWNNHKSDMRKGEHENPGIREDAAIYGVEALEFEALVYCMESEMEDLEARFINKRIHSVRCYNRRDGDGSYEFSEEHKAKISENSARYWEGKTRSEETKAKLRKPKPKTTCPHCGLTGGANAMKRYHFANCKLRRE